MKIQRVPLSAAFMIVALISSAWPTAVGATVTPDTDTVQVPAGSSVDHLISVGVPDVPPKADILIAIDTTGSMGASIAQAKTNANSIVSGVQGSVADTEFAIVNFKDSIDGASEYRVVQALTASPTAVQTAINGLSAGGGGDLPEAHNLVFHNSYTPATGGLIGWRSGTKKIVVVISDAEPHGAGTAGLAGCTDTTPDPHGFSTATELAGMAGADRTLFMVRQAGTASTLACYESIAGATGGTGVNSGTALGTQIVSLITTEFNAVTELHMEVASATPSPAVPGWISFDPSSIPAAPTHSTQPFTAHITVPEGTPSGSYAFDLKAVGDGADYGHQALTVVVPSSTDIPILVRAVGGLGGGVSGRLHSTPSTTQAVTFSYNPTTCEGATGTRPIGTIPVLLDTAGDAQFVATISDLPTTGGFVWATATENGSTSDPSPCIVLGPGNDSWPNALDISGSHGNQLSPAAPGYAIDSPGQSRWYKFAVTPGSQVQIDLSNLPADYDLVLFKDIDQAYKQLSSQSDLIKLSAEFAGQAFTGQAFTGQAFTGQAFTGQAFTADTFSGQAFTGQAFTGQAFTGQAFTGQAFTGQAFTGQAFTGQAFTGQAFTAQAFTGQAFTGDAFTGQAFTGQAFTPADFASAQTRSGLAVSATTGLGNEAITENTWNETGYFYIRVTGRDGAFDPDNAFTLHETQTGTECGAVHPSAIAAPSDAADTGVKTVILTDSSRLVGSDVEKTALATKLDAFAARTEVGGVVVDVGGNPRVHGLNVQADDNAACPYAENLVASALRDIVHSYRANNPGLAYVVLVGGDSAIPFFRYADQSGLAPESGYIPPVSSTSASEASLRLNYTLSQDAYGDGTQISQGANAFPVPDLAVGRLVENASDATTMLDAYLGTTDGVVAPTSSLVTGYDFLEDAANAVQTDLSAGIGLGSAASPTLISANYTQPADGWTATDLKTAFLGSRHDISFLAGHFSAKSALAADFATTMTTADLAASTTDFVNSIVFSAGCHSGYNVVDADGAPANVDVLDWSQAFARKGATLIGGTGYQYGDTDLVMYSEQIYSSFAHELRMGEGPISVGQALIRAKQDYLRTTPSLQGIDQKALLEATLFGLPMLSVNLPNGRIPIATDTSDVSASDVTDGPGVTLGLKSADLDVVSDVRTTGHPTGVLEQKTKTLQGSKIVDGVPTPFNVTTTYYEGPDGVSSKPYEPTLPLITKNVDVPGYTLRGIGFRGGSYADSSVTPLSGGPATEFGVPHTPFASSTFYPIHLANPNYFDALGGGAARLMVTPAQHQSNGTADNTSTLRLYSDVNVRLFYSHNITSLNGLTPALAAAPGIYDVTASETTPGTITVKAHVVGDPSAGIQGTWVTWTGFDHAWHSVDLAQSDTADSTLWTGTIPVNGGHAASDVKFMLQAVNGVGLVGLNDNYASYYSVAPVGPAPATTHLTLDASPTDGVFDDTVAFTATLTSDAGPIASQPVVFTLGGVTSNGTTDLTGAATVDFRLTPTPGDYSLHADYAGNATYAHSTDARPFTILTRTPEFSLNLSGLPPVTFGDAPFSVAGRVSKTAGDDGAVTFALASGSLGCSVTPDGVVTITGGTTAQNLCSITASIAATARYDKAGPVGDTFAIGQAGQTITFAPLPGRTYLQPDFTVSATASSALTVSFTAAGQCAVTGSSVHLTGAGSCTITANQAGTADWNAATPVGQAFSIVNPVPTVTSVVPPSIGRGAISFPVTVVGTGFVPGAAVTISGTGVTVNSTAYVNSTHLTASLSVTTSASLTNRNVSVSNLGTAAGTCTGCLGINQGPYGIAPVPGSVGRGALNENISVIGFNFVSGTWTPSSVQFSGLGITVNSVTRVNSLVLTVNLTVDPFAATGARSVTVVNPDGGRSTALAAFTVTAAPTITSLSPNSRGQGAANEKVVLTGSGFLSGTWSASSVSFSGTGITVSSVSRTDSSHLSVTLSITGAAAPGAGDVTVRNLDGGRATKVGGFTVNAGPGPISLSPGARGQGAANQVIVITGSNFGSGSWPTSAVAFSGSGITVNSVTRTDASHLSVNVSISTTAAVGARTVTVRNLDSGTASLANGFSVNARPTITSLGPNSRARGQANQIIVVTGTGFVNGGTVSFSGSGISIVSVIWTDSSHLSVKISVAPGASTGYRNVTVTNPDQGSFTLSNGFKVT